MISSLSNFHSGTSFDAYQLFGAHPLTADVTCSHWHFRVWAPNALRVQVMGDFNHWQGTDLSMDSPGIWSGHISNAYRGQFYKYNIQGKDGSWVLHSDPYAFYSELRPGTASVLWGLPQHLFHDNTWMQTRTQRYNDPLNIYELHLGSWKRHPDGRWYTYSELAASLIPWLVQHHYNYIEILPLAEHPHDGSWGYQDTGYFSVTSRYGTPEDFCAFVDACHASHIGVIMDFVPVHFACNSDGLARFDGTHLYEYDSDVGLSEWGSYNFNLYRKEVRSFLNSAAALWLGVYHCDGLRINAISRAIYWQGDINRGVNQGAVDFLRNLNSGLLHRWPNALLIAEDSTTFLKVTAPVAYEGLGFTYKWNMGWMHDTLDYFSTPFHLRPHKYHQIIFSMQYFYNELYLLALSHDEVVHGKRTLIDKMWGTYSEKFAQARLLSFYMMMHPGKKLHFMGEELAHFREWDENREMDWCLLDFPLHQAFSEYISQLNALYQTEPSLYSEDYHPDYFQWIVKDAAKEGIVAFLRKSKSHRPLLILFNTSTTAYSNYKLQLNFPCCATPVLCTEQHCFGGSLSNPLFSLFTQPNKSAACMHTLTTDLLPLCGYVYRLT